MTTPAIFETVAAVFAVGTAVRVYRRGRAIRRFQAELRDYEVR